MPKTGYKQSKEHIKNKVNAKTKKPKTKRRKKAKPIEETPPAVYRDYKCTHYSDCLKQAALTDKEFNCTGCQKCQHAIPQESPIFNELVTMEAVACTHLLRAIFAPQSWRLEERAKEKAMKQKRLDVQAEDQPEKQIEWWG